MGYKTDPLKQALFPMEIISTKGKLFPTGSQRRGNRQDSKIGRKERQENKKTRKQENKKTKL